MKTILLIIISFFLIEISFAQTGADYYLPLCTGNFLKLYTGGTPGGSGWEARHTFYGIFRSDVINGKLYFLEKGILQTLQYFNVFGCVRILSGIF